MVIFGREINLSMFLGFNGSQKTPLFRWLLIPTVLFLTVVPSRILLLAQNRISHHTTIISLEDDNNIDSKISQGLFLTTNNLYLGGEMIYLICGWSISLFGIFGCLRKNNVVGQFISAFLIAFTVIHAISAAYTVLFSGRWIFRVLDNTWENSFVHDNELIKDIQNEFLCKGFSSIFDRSIITTTTSQLGKIESIISPSSLSSIPKNSLPFEHSCAKILMQRFGPYLFHIAKIIFLARFIQLLAVLLHTFILHCVIVNDIQQSIQQEECEEYNGNIIINNNNEINNNSNSSSNSNNSNDDNNINNHNNNNRYYDDDKYYNYWELDDEDVENAEEEDDDDVIDDENDDVVTYRHNLNHQKYNYHTERVGGVNGDESIDELIEKNIDLIKFNNSILKSIYYNSRN